MITILILILIFLFPSLSFAGVKYDVSCPVDTPVEISFEWSSKVDITAASNIVSFTLPDTPVGVFSSFKISAESGSAGVVPLTFSSGSFQNISCVSKPFTLIELYLKLYSFALGVILALAFIGGIKSHES